MTFLHPYAAATTATAVCYELQSYIGFPQGLIRVDDDDVFIKLPGLPNRGMLCGYIFLYVLSCGEVMYYTIRNILSDTREAEKVIQQSSLNLPKVYKSQKCRLDCN